MNVEASQKEWSKTKSKAYLDSTAILLKSGKVKDFDHSSTLINYYSYSAEWARLFEEYKLGYQYLYRLSALSDSIHSVRSLKDFNEMQIKYEVARKEKDLEIANQKSTLQMLWFGGAFTLLLIVSLVIFFYFRNRNKIRSLEQMLRVRNRISSDLHDDVGSALSSITIITDMVRSQLRNNPEKAGELLEKISETSIEVMGNMKDIVWSINPKNDSLESLLNKIREFASDILDSQNIGLVMEDETKGSTHLDLAFRQDVYLILKEAINNIAKYSKANLVKIRILNENETFCIEISDNGIGFHPETVEQGNGLGNMKTRAEKMDGTLNIQSAEGGGTKITLRV